MKVITIESSAYQAMMEQITEIAGYIRELKEEKQRQDAATKDCLLNTAQAAELLNVSTRTLQRMRDDHPHPPPPPPLRSAKIAGNEYRQEQGKNDRRPVP